MSSTPKARSGSMFVFITMRSGRATCPRARAFESGPEVLHRDSGAAEVGGSVFASKPGSFLVSAEAARFDLCSLPESLAEIRLYIVSGQISKPGFFKHGFQMLDRALIDLVGLLRAQWRHGEFLQIKFRPFPKCQFPSSS